MSYKRFWGTGAAVGSWAALTEESLAHAKVVRLRPGEGIELMDGMGHYWRGVFKDNGIAVESIGEAAAPKPRITLAVGVTQGGTFDDIVRQAVEIGVNEILPLRSQYGAVGIDEKRAEGKHERWSRIIDEACKQCGQYWRPKLYAITDFKKALELKTGATNLVAALLPTTKRWAEIPLKTAEEIVIWVGPEGDLSPSEYEALATAKAFSVSLGSTVLRVETATIAAVAMIRAQLEK